MQNIFSLTNEDLIQNNCFFLFSELQADTEYKVRVLAGTAVGYPKLLDAQWPWLIHRTPKHNEKPQGSYKILCINTHVKQII